MKKHTVLLADDHKMIAEALKNILQSSYEVLGVVQDGRAVVDAALKLQPDVVVLDIGMPLLNGLDAGRQIKKAMPRVKLLALTMNPEPRLVSEALRFGFSAYVLKHDAVTELLNAVRDALRGGTYISKELGVTVPEILVDHAPARAEEDITPRQREIMQLLAEGRAMKEVADILHISIRTVADHKYRIMARLGLKTNADLYHYAAKHGLISL